MSLSLSSHKSSHTHSLSAASGKSLHRERSDFITMLSPNPLPIICALLLCFPLAIVFTTTSTTFNHQANTTNLNPTPSIFSQSKANLISRFFGNTQNPNRSAESAVSPPKLPSRPPPLPENDELLLRIAAHVKAKPIKPKKIAFLFLTTTPLPFAPLWESYFNQTPKHRFNIYIHANPDSSYDPPFSGVFSNRVIHSKHTERYSPTLASAARRLLAHALIDDPSNYVFALLSASCIPLHSFNFTYKTLINSRKSFIEILQNEVGAYDRWAARGADTMLPEVKLEDFRIGSQFWALTRKHARLVVSDQILWSKFGLPCVRLDSCYPEENYFPTLLSMWDARGCVPATLTHVDWKGREDGHPRTYEAWEVGPELIMNLRKERPRYGDRDMNGSDLSRSIRHDPFLFARKFAPDALEPLMEIAKDSILKD